MNVHLHTYEELLPAVVVIVVQGVAAVAVPGACETYGETYGHTYATFALPGARETYGHTLATFALP